MTMKVSYIASKEFTAAFTALPQLQNFCLEWKIHSHLTHAWCLEICTPNFKWCGWIQDTVPENLDKVILGLVVPSGLNAKFGINYGGLQHYLEMKGLKLETQIYEIPYCSSGLATPHWQGAVICFDANWIYQMSQELPWALSKGTCFPVPYACSYALSANLRDKYHPYLSERPCCFTCVYFV